MMRIPWPRWGCVALFAAMALAVRQHDAAAQTPRAIDIGQPVGAIAPRSCTSDSILTVALAAFNSPAAVHVFGAPGGFIPAGVTIDGGFSVYRGGLLVDGTVRGDVVVLNGDVRVRSTGTITGRLIVLGGRTTVDPGAKVVGNHSGCEQPVSLTRLADNTIARSTPTPSIGSISSALTREIGGFRFTPRLGLSQYNRIEGLPVQLGVNVMRPVGGSDTVRGELYGIARSARDPSESRPAVGWWGMARYAHSGNIPFSVTIAGGSRIEATRDQPFSALESALSALVLRRDYNDWYLARSISISASIRPMRELTVTGSLEATRQTTVLAVDALSLLRSADPWRPNPLIDDGRYHIATGSITWDARDEQDHPGLSWLVRGQLRRVSSNDLTPVSIPTTIRDALPVTGYGATEGDLDIRASLRLAPEQRLNFRISAGGYVTGDPLTIQSRRAIGGANPLLGYDFRALNCDRQRRVYTSTPALCDRTMAVQAEYRRTLLIDIGTQVGGQNIGIHNPDLVFLGDMGSAWLAGDTPGRVPTNRIQALREWRSDVGVGITSGPVGVYLSKALADALPLRLTLLFTPRL